MGLGKFRLFAAEVEDPAPVSELKLLGELLDGLEIETGYSGHVRLLGNAKAKEFLFGLVVTGAEDQAAEAAECAGEQDKYWEMHDMLYDEGVSGGVDDFKQYASDLGLDTGEFNDCLDSGAMEAEVDNDIADAQELGIYGVPTFLINDDKIAGAQSYETFEQVIESYLE